MLLGMYTLYTCITCTTKTPAIVVGDISLHLVNLIHVQNKIITSRHVVKT